MVSDVAVRTSAVAAATPACADRLTRGFFIALSAVGDLLNSTSPASHPVQRDQQTNHLLAT